jgi:GNAT superfamily N-acetyltransferase
MTADYHTLTTALPPDFAALRAEALREGHRFLERLDADWQAGTMRFDNSGERLLAATIAEKCAGIGGLTRDPSIPEALRLRRFYVHPQHRRAGIGSGLAERLLAHARAHTRLVTVNAGTPDAAAFWEKRGFSPATQPNITHLLAL